MLHTGDIRLVSVPGLQQPLALLSAAVQAIKKADMATLTGGPDASRGFMLPLHSHYCCFPPPSDRPWCFSLQARGQPTPSCSQSPHAISARRATSGSMSMETEHSC